MSNANSVGNSGLAPSLIKPHGRNSDSLGYRSDDKGQGDNSSGKQAFEQWLDKASNKNAAATPPLNTPLVQSENATFSPIAAMAPVPLREDSPLASQPKHAAKKRQRRE